MAKGRELFLATPQLNGRVKVSTTGPKGDIISHELQQQSLAFFVTHLLEAAIDAQKMTGEKAQTPAELDPSTLTGIVPSYVSVSRVEGQSEPILVVHCANCRFGISIPNIRQLGEVLLAETAGGNAN